MKLKQDPRKLLVKFGSKIYGVYKTEDAKTVYNVVCFNRARTFGRATVRRGTVRRKKNVSFG